jgi:hypothetical protein
MLDDCLACEQPCAVGGAARRGCHCQCHLLLLAAIAKVDGPGASSCAAAEMSGHFRL